MQAIEKDLLVEHLNESKHHIELKVYAKELEINYYHLHLLQKMKLVSKFPTKDKDKCFALSSIIVKS